MNGPLRAFGHCSRQIGADARCLARVDASLAKKAPPLATRGCPLANRRRSLAPRAPASAPWMAPLADRTTAMARTTSLKAHGKAPAPRFSPSCGARAWRSGTLVRVEGTLLHVGGISRRDRLLNDAVQCANARVMHAHERTQMPTCRSRHVNRGPSCGRLPRVPPSRSRTRRNRSESPRQPGSSVPSSPCDGWNQGDHVAIGQRITIVCEGLVAGDPHMCASLSEPAMARREMFGQGPYRAYVGRHRQRLFADTNGIAQARKVKHADDHRRPSRYWEAGRRRRIRRSTSRSNGCSSRSQKEIARPDAPARPVRPMRWT